MNIVCRPEIARTQTTTAADLIGNAASMIPALRSRTSEAARLRRLPDDSSAELRETGLARLMQPKRFGGAEAPIGAMVEVMIPVAGGCPSTAWCLAQYIMHNYLIARWPAKAQEVIWEKPDSLVSGILIPRLGKARPVKGGYRISGTWPFVSGVDPSDWCMFAATVEDTTAEVRYFVLPTSAVVILDTWYSIGLRGSGSHDVQVTDCFVPDYMTVPVDLLKGAHSPGRSINLGTIYTLPVHMTFGIVLAASIVGMAESMFESFLIQSRDRRSLMSSEDTASFQTHQARVGEVSSSLQAAEALLRADCNEMMEFANAGVQPNNLERSSYRCNSAFAGMLAQRAAQTVWDLVGARGAYEANTIAQIYQDVAVATRHATMNMDVNAIEHGRARLRMRLTNPAL